MTPWLLSWETNRKMKAEKLSNCSSLCVLIAYLTIWNLSGSPVALRNSLHSLSKGQTPQFKLCYQTKRNQLMLSREGDPWQFKEQVLIRCKPVAFLRSVPSQWRHFPDQIGNWACWFMKEGEHKITWRKPFEAKKRTNKNVNSLRTQTWAKLVEGNCSHHCAILACFSKYFLNG